MRSAPTSAEEGQAMTGMTNGLLEMLREMRSQAMRGCGRKHIGW